MSDVSEQIDWFLRFIEVFEALKGKRLAHTRAVVDNKKLKWSTKLFGTHECDKCEHVFSSANCQVEFHYRLVPRYERGELRVYKQFGQRCRKCEDMAYIIPKIDPDDKLFAMECLLVKIKKFFYDESHDMPTRKYRPPGHGSHHSEGCEACSCGVCRANPLFQGVLVDQSVFPRPPADNNPRVVDWKLYFGCDKEAFELSFEDRCTYERLQQEQRALAQNSASLCGPDDLPDAGRGIDREESPTLEDDLEHGERMSDGDAERTVFSSRRSSVSNGNDVNNNDQTCSSNASNVEQMPAPPMPRGAAKVPAKPELTIENFDDVYNGIFSVK